MGEAKWKQFVIFGGEETIDAKKKLLPKKFKKHRLCLNAIDVTNFCAKVAVTAMCKLNMG